MTLSQLRTFLAVADSGSVRAAAERLVVSQPAVSAAVATLERELGVDLVAREGRGLRITPAGAAFATTVRASLSRLAHGVREARSVEDPGRGTARIAAVTTAAERMLLPLLGDFRREHPTPTSSCRSATGRPCGRPARPRRRPRGRRSAPPLTRVRSGDGPATVSPRRSARPPPTPRSGRTASLARTTWLLRRRAPARGGHR
ncbi:MAG: LysR family transcriptional regulator [Acidimicrobiales bacterium]